MTDNLVTLAEHTAFVLGAWIVLRVWFAFDRFICRVSTIVLLFLGQYGWALLAFALLCIAENAHRALMAQRRAAGFYNGPWID
jgi:uncharacterized membrane protein